MQLHCSVQESQAIFSVAVVVVVVAVVPRFRALSLAKKAVLDEPAARREGARSCKELW